MHTAEQSGPEGTEPITFHWSREHGDCQECSNPAAYLVLDAYGDGKHMPTCALCAAEHASFGMRIEKIEKEN